MPIKWPKGKRPVFVGTGNTVAVRYGDRSLSSLANEAALEAIADAGLEPSDIDGISVYPMAPYANARNIPGYDIVDEVHMQHILPLKNVRWTCNSGNKMAVTSIIEAANALASGAVSYVLVYRALHHPAGERYNLTPPGASADEAQWLRPYGFGTGSNHRQALDYMRYLEKFGARREEMAAVVLNANRNAQLNEYAYWKGRTITPEDYMNARMIAWPMCILDFDMPLDEAGALVMTTEDRAAATPHPGGYIAGYAGYPRLRGPARPCAGAGGAVRSGLPDGQESVRKRPDGTGGCRPHTRLRRIQPHGLELAGVPGVLRRGRGP